MRLSSAPLVLTLSAQAIAHPLIRGLLLARDDSRDQRKATTTTRAAYSVVPIDGGCSGPDCNAPTVTVTKSTAPTSGPSHMDSSIASATTTRRRIPVVPIDGEPTTVTVYDPTSSPSSPFFSSTIATSASTMSPIRSSPPSPSSSEGVSSPTSAPTTPSLSSAVPSRSEYPASSSSSPPLDPTPSASAPPEDPPETSSVDPNRSTEPAVSSSQPPPVLPIPPLPSSAEPETTVSISAPAEWAPEPSPSTSASLEPSYRPSEVSSIASSGTSLSAIPTSFPHFPTTFITVSSITDPPISEPSSTQSFDNGLWYSSKYPSWNGTNNRYFK
ncbi:hypothetical protein ACRALDRAFT_1062012 [Sodiomyces alcalophilus JCM 7366]|uniref:uncharacterized protein n=1 Tax=Sodiomyces alcalophilus JCM 7366 TaxID=591952 RepID=UPI0039B4D275